MITCFEESLNELTRKCNGIQASALVFIEKEDYKDGWYYQVMSNTLDIKLREKLEHLKKIRNHWDCHHYWGLHVWGQHTKNPSYQVEMVDLLV